MEMWRFTKTITEHCIECRLTEARVAATEHIIRDLPLLVIEWYDEDESKSDQRHVILGSEPQQDILVIAVYNVENVTMDEEIYAFTTMMANDWESLLNNIFIVCCNLI